MISDSKKNFPTGELLKLVDPKKITLTCWNMTILINSLDQSSVLYPGEIFVTFQDVSLRFKFPLVPRIRDKVLQVKNVFARIDKLDPILRKEDVKAHIQLESDLEVQLNKTSEIGPKSPTLITIQFPNLTIDHLKKYWTLLPDFELVRFGSLFDSPQTASVSFEDNVFVIKHDPFKVFEIKDLDTMYLPQSRYILQNPDKSMTFSYKQTHDIKEGQGHISSEKKFNIGTNLQTQEFLGFAMGQIVFFSYDMFRCQDELRLPFKKGTMESCAPTNTVLWFMQHGFAHFFKYFGMLSGWKDDLQGFEWDMVKRMKIQHWDEFETNVIYDSRDKSTLEDFVLIINEEDSIQLWSISRSDYVLELDVKTRSLLRYGKFVPIKWKFPDVLSNIRNLKSMDTFIKFD